MVVFILLSTFVSMGVKHHFQTELFLELILLQFSVELRKWQIFDLLKYKSKMMKFSETLYLRCEELLLTLTDS